MRSRDLADAGTLQDADWADVYAIVAQVAKIGRYPAWREEEQVKGLTLSPDYFVLPDPTIPLVDLPEWRATLQARSSNFSSASESLRNIHMLVAQLPA